MSTYPVVWEATVWADFILLVESCDVDVSIKNRTLESIEFFFGSFCAF